MSSIEGSIQYIIEDYPADHLKKYPDAVDDLNRALEPLQNQLYLVKSWQLTEEKRRLLTCIIEWMSAAVEKGAVLTTHVRPNIFRLVELQKRVNSAATMEELAQISEELAKFKQDHPELGQ